MRTIILLTLSNVFMTVAWYGHLRFKHLPLVLVIAASWLIALPEYCLQVPANRLGHGRFTGAQLKIIQEAISITVFVVFSVLYLKETPGWRSAAAFALIFAAVVLATGGATAPAESPGRAVAAEGGERPLEVGR